MILNTKCQRIYLFLLIPLFLLSLSSNLFGMDHEVVFTDGYPYMRDSDGYESDLEIGDYVSSGDTIVTDSGDFCELEAEGYAIKISENTVFSILELEQGGQKTDVLSCALGKLTFSKDKFLGTEPKLRTSSAICGVRGTNVVLLAGVDGSSLFVVEEGAVEVEAGGEKVELAVGEGVEVDTGQAPGTKFKAMERETDFSSWNQGRLDTLLKDPVEAAIKIETQLAGYVAEIKKIHPLYLESKKKLEEEGKKAKDIAAEKGDDEGKKYYLDVVRPLELETTFLYLNIRYYALSSLSLRRFVSGRIYLILKSMYITDRQNAVYRRFLEVHNRVLRLFEEDVVKLFIVKADI